MDLQRVVQPSDPLNSINHTSETMGTSHQHAMTGGTLVQHSIYDGTNQPIMNSLSMDQRQAVSMNPDLRKKLRVDRVRKMTLGNNASLASVEDPSQPDWMKVKSLREIETIRETKKRDIINQMIGGDG